MRPTTRLLAAVRANLEPGNPTGLTGLHTLPAPRSTLIHLYSSTLSKLSQIPASSIYRQSTESLTKSRLAIVQAHKPPGYDAWQDRVRFQMDRYRQEAAERGEAPEDTLNFEGQEFVMAQMGEENVDERDVQWEGTVRDKVAKPWLEGPMAVEFREQEQEFKAKEEKELRKQRVIIEPEPPFTMDQVEDIESKIGAGLLEEVIQVAQGENLLAEVMVKNKVWEELCEKSPPGQWEYFERTRHTNTQKP